VSSGITIFARICKGRFYNKIGFATCYVSKKKGPSHGASARVLELGAQRPK